MSKVGLKDLAKKIMSVAKKVAAPAKKAAPVKAKPSVKKMEAKKVVKKVMAKKAAVKKPAAKKVAAKKVVVKKAVAKKVVAKKAVKVAVKVASKPAQKHRYERIALACQGGGSLGAYHIGVVQAMAENGYHPDVVSGISIGAFTAALIAGNDPKDRVEVMKEFWKTISYPEFGQGIDMDVDTRRMHNKFSSMQGFIFGQPNFFEPRNPGPQMQVPGTIEATSYYDTSPLRETLLKFVNFDRINSGKTRLLLGSTRVKDGELVFFDSAKMKIGPEHVMSSGSMPPGFPGIRIDGDLYWDGGCVSNTPVQGIFDIRPVKDTLTFVVDLFNPIGKEPQNMDDVNGRMKDIQFTTRTAHHLEHISHRHNLKRALHEMFKKMPASMSKDPVMKELQDMASDSHFDVVHVAYSAPDYELDSRDCEFSRMSIIDRAEHGYSDMARAIKDAPWLKRKPNHVGSIIHKFTGKRKRA